MACNIPATLAVLALRCPRAAAEPTLPHLMRFPVFSRSLNPAVDPPLCRKSKTYVLDLLKTGDAFMVGSELRNGVQLRARAALPRPVLEMKAALTDWRTVPVSFLPHGEVLVITTKQLRTA